MHRHICMAYKMVTCKWFHDFSSLGLIMCHKHPSVPAHRALWLCHNHSLLPSCELTGTVIPILATWPHFTARCLSVCLSGVNWQRICYKWKWNTVSKTLSTVLKQNGLSNWEFYHYFSYGILTPLILSSVDSWVISDFWFNKQDRNTQFTLVWFLKTKLQKARLLGTVYTTRIQRETWQHTHTYTQHIHSMTPGLRLHKDTLMKKNISGAQRLSLGSWPRASPKDTFLWQVWGLNDTGLLS